MSKEIEKEEEVTEQEDVKATLPPKKRSVKAPIKDDGIEIDESDAVEANQEEVTEQEEIPGVPNRVAPKTEIIRVAGKDVVLPKFFTANTAAGLVAYGPTGQRVSPPAKEQDERVRLTKRIAHMNVRARQNVLPGDLKPAGTQPAR